MIKEIIKKNRSYRRFDQGYEISRNTLTELIDLARLSPSAGNLQSLKYILVCDEPNNSVVFNTLGWAGYLQDWPGPVDGERPSAYIIILGDTTISKNFFCDHGIASQSILLGAVEKRLGGCIFGTINRPELTKALNIDDGLEILLVIALGKSVEQVQIETAENGDIKYWRDDNAVHHVPKRPLNEVIIG